MGLDGRDSVQLPKNRNPDAGAEHTLPDPNGVLGRTGSLQASVREMNLVLTAVLPYLVLLLWSDQSQCLLCIQNWLDMEMSSIFSLLCIQKVPYQIRLLFTPPETCVNPLLPAFPSLCMSCCLSAPHSPRTLILQGGFLLVLLRDHTHPETLICLTFFSILALLEGSSLSTKCLREHACSERKQSSSRPAVLYPSTTTLMKSRRGAAVYPSSEGIH